MKKYIVETLGGASKKFQFGSLEEAKNFADKHQKIVKSPVEVFEKIGEDSNAIYYNPIYRANGLPHTAYSYIIYK